MSNWFGFNIKSTRELAESELPEMFPMGLSLSVFRTADILNTYVKILTDVIERTHGLPKKLQPLLWDNCLQSEANEGLITLLAKAMANKTDLFLVYAESVKVVRKADSEEEKQIRIDYKERGESEVGIFVSFRNYLRTDMLNIYSEFEYCVLSSLNKGLNLATAIQIGIKDLRASVNVVDAELPKAQAKSIAQALGRGKDVLLDVEDKISTSVIDTAPTEKAIVFLAAKRAFILGLPLSYLAGDLQTGLGDSGNADARAVDRGLKPYFASVVYPVLLALFGADTEFRSEDDGQMTIALEAAKTFELVSDDTLSQDAKRSILARLFDLDEEEERKALESQPPSPEKPDPNAPPAKDDPNAV